MIPDKLSAEDVQRLAEPRVAKNKPTRVEVLVRATLALRYARRRAISQPMIDAVGMVLDAHASKKW